MEHLCILLLTFSVLTNSNLIPTKADTYDTKYDNIDIDELLSNDRLLNNYIKCLENKGACTPDGKMLKELPQQVIDIDLMLYTRNPTGRSTNELFEVLRKAKEWSRSNNPLLDRSQIRRLGKIGENLRSRQFIPSKLFGFENYDNRKSKEIKTELKMQGTDNLMKL